MIKRPQFIFLANDLCLDFLNTEVIGPGGKSDLLGSYSHFLQWMNQAGLISQSQQDHLAIRTKDPESMLSAVKDFRAQLREMVEVIISGKPVSRATIAQINKLLKHESGHHELDLKQTLEYNYIRPFQHPEELLAVLASIAAELLCNKRPNLIKQCGNPGCILYFYDTTKNHKKRWCNTDTCGNLMKVKRYRKRLRDAR